MALHPTMAARAAATKAVYAEKKSDPGFMAKPPKQRFAEVSREVSKRVGGKK